MSLSRSSFPSPSAWIPEGLRRLFATKPIESWAAVLAGIALLLLVLIVGSPDHLDSGMPVRRTLAGGESHLYRLSLRRSDLWQLTLIVKQGQLQTRIFDSLGRRIVDLDSSQVPGGREVVLGRAEEKARYWVEISSTQPVGRQVRYELRARVESELSPLGRLRWEAGTAMLEGRALLRRRENASRAVAQLRQSTLLWKRAGEAAPQATTLYLEAVAELARKNAEGALRLLSQAGDLYAEMGDDAGTAAVLAATGRALEAKGDRREAVELWKQAGDAFANLGDFPNEATCRIEEAALHHSQGSYEKARRCLYRAQEIAHQEGDFRISVGAASQLCNISFNLGDFDGTLDAIDVLRRHAGSNEVFLLQLEAMIYTQKGELDHAEQIIERLLGLIKDDPANKSFVYNLRGNVYLRREMYGRAEEDYKRALLWARISEHQPVISSALGNLGIIALHTKNFRRALQLHSEILEVYRASGERFNEVATHINLARSYNATGGSAAESMELQQTRSLIEELRKDSRDPDLRIENLRGLQGFYTSLVAYLSEKGEAECAFEVAEASRARSLLDQWSPEKQDISVEPIEVPCLDESPLKALSEIRRLLLDRRTALLSFKLDEAQIYAWWIDDSGLTEVKIPLRAQEVETLTSQIHGYFRKASGAKLGSAAAKKLSQHLFGQFADRMEHIERLLVVTDGDLQYIPFSALPDPRDGTPLLERLEISYIPSVTALLRLRASSAPHRYSKDIGIFAAPLFQSSGEWSALPHTRLEAEQLLALFPGEEKSQAFLGPDASVSRFLSEDLSAYRYLHFATHGSFNRMVPEASSLVLSELDSSGRPTSSSALYPYQIAGRKLNAELVVLSACETGLANSAGEGMIGLPRAFLVAGAKRVVVSLWLVEDKATQELMVRFYGGLRRGLPPASALRQAQMQVRGLPGFEAPSNWAGFVLYGLP